MKVFWAKLKLNYNAWLDQMTYLPLVDKLKKKQN